MTDDYRRRAVDDDLDALFDQLPAILLDGPKGVGKTETAARRAATILRLDVPAQLQIVAADPDLALRGEPPVLVDEWHRHPPIWDAVKRAVDRDHSGGRFLLTGSSPLGGPATHSGAARITRLRMRPMMLAERGVGEPSVSLATLATGTRPRLSGATTVDLDGYTHEIVTSGLPGLRQLPSRAHRLALDGYIEQLVERDLPELGLTVGRPATMLAWLRAYAAATSTVTTWEKIREAAAEGERPAPSRATTVQYAEALRALRVLDPVPAWSPTRNRLRRLGASQKHHLMEPAVTARLLGVDESALLSGEQGPGAALRDAPLLGALFESLATLHVRVLAQPAELRVHHLRVRGGEHETDLVLERGDGRVVAIEVKLAGVVDDADVHHLRWLEYRLGEDLLDAVVLTTGPGAYRRDDGIGVVPLALLGP